MANILARFTILVLLLLSFPALCAAAADPQLPEELTAPSAPFLPYSRYLLDEGGNMDISEAAAPQRAGEYGPLDLKDLPRETGAIWLRFTLAPLKGQRPAVFLLDMGESVPGVPVLYEPVFNPLSATREWRESSPAQRNVFLLPEAGAESLTCYIRLDGLPGPWFAPMLRTPHNAATDLAGMAHSAALLALCVVMLLCLLRGLSEQGQWRYWTAFYVAVALVQGMSGLPASSTGHFSMSALPAVLAPGLALMLLPHVGRHLMHTRENSRALDLQLLFLSLPGAALALLPLIPQYAWLSRFLDLWPLGTLLFIPTAMGACIKGLNGSKRFLLGCILPPLCIVGGLLGLESDLPANLLAAAPLCGVALTALLIAATRAPQPVEQAEKSTERSVSAPHSREKVISLEHPLNDPTLRLIPAEPVAASVAPAGLDEGPQGEQEKAEAFNLQHLMREVHDAVAPAAEGKGIGLSWYMPPYLEQMYEGPALALSSALRLLLESAVCATTQGAVQFSVRPQPEGSDSGQLLFAVHDTGSALPSQGRSMLALSRAWELAGMCGGTLNVAYETQNTTISFTVHLRALDHRVMQDVQGAEQPEAPQESLPLALLVAPQEKDRQEMHDMLVDMSCRCMTFASLADALSGSRGMTAIVVIRGALATPDAGPLLREIEKRNEGCGAASPRVLAITPDDRLWDTLAQTGFTHALLEPLDAADLRKTVEDALQNTAVRVDAKTDVHSGAYRKKPAEPSTVPDLFSGLESVAAPVPGSSQKSLPDLDLSLLPGDTPVGSQKEDAPKVADTATASGPKVSSAAPEADQEDVAAVFAKMPGAMLVPVRSTRSKSPQAENAASHRADVTEWVGEPMPIGTPVTQQTNDRAEMAKMAEAAAATEPSTAPQPVATGYSSPSVQTPGEWVGEPMPIQRPAVSGAEAPQKAEPAGVQPTADAVPQQTVQSDTPSPESTSASDPTTPPDKASLPGSDRTLQDLVARLDAAMDEARQAFDEGQGLKAGMAAGRIAAESEAFGFRVLARMARCVERAAKANDMSALKDLLPELAVAVERNRIALSPRR